MYIMDTYDVKNHQDSSQEPTASSKTPRMMLWRTQELENLQEGRHIFVSPSNMMFVPLKVMEDKEVDREDMVDM